MTFVNSLTLNKVTWTPNHRNLDALFEDSVLSMDALQDTFQQRPGSLMDVIKDKTTLPFFLTPSFTPVADAVNAVGHSPGIHVILGDTGAGKTVHIYREVKPDVLIRFGEPLEYVDAQDYVVQALTPQDALAAAARIAAGGRTVAIDSMRLVMYGLDGPAMSGGISTAMFEALTRMNNFVASFGGLVYLAINPMVDDIAVLPRLHTRIAATVAGATWINEYQIAAATYRSVTSADRKGASRSETDLVLGTDPVPVTMIDMDEFVSHDPSELAVAASPATSAPVYTSFDNDFF